MVVFDGASFRDVTDANEDDDTRYRPFGWTPQVGSALYLGFAQSDPPALPPFFPPRLSLCVFRARNSAAARALLCTGASAPPSPPVTLVWECRKDAANLDRWKALNTYDDGSARFTSEGYIEIEGPGEIVPSRVVSQSEPELYLGCAAGWPRAATRPERRRRSSSSGPMWCAPST